MLSAEILRPLFLDFLHLPPHAPDRGAHVLLALAVFTKTTVNPTFFESLIILEYG